MIACALVAGIGTALFNPSALASVSQVARREHRPAAMSLYSALDDLGLTLGPALAGALLIAFDPHTLMAINAGTFTISAGLLATIPLERAGRARGRRRCSRRMRSGTREIVALPGVRLLLGSSTVAVVAVGMVNVGEVMLARELLGVGGSGLAALMTASGVGTFLGSTFGARTGTTWQWRRAYIAGLMCMAADLMLCAVAPYFWLLAGDVRARRLRQRPRARPRPPAARPRGARAAARPAVRAPQDLHLGAPSSSPSCSPAR